MLPENQNQHRVSQVYLKQFGFQAKEQWLLAVYRIGNKETEQVPVREFTAANNIFDHPYGDIEFRRNFETQCGKIESLYPVILSNLDNQRQITDKNVEVLCHFIASLLTRSTAFTNFIQLILKDGKAKKRFIGELSAFKPENKKLMESLLPHIPPEMQLNTLLGTVTEHLVEVFRHFNFAVFENSGDIFWATTDNPVVLDKKGNFEWLVSPDSEIYLPLSKRYCLFLYHDEATDKTNPLRLGKPNKINQLDTVTFEIVQKKIIYNLINFFVIPVALPVTDISPPGVRY
ncbi:DUF4238 domain-containing protein [Mucilaginibacter sp.]|uniref:DUF4238 domain-containing protein n=1 Tax=Mucilaginibacter sp. TaxID=1882438 RepID=UPI0025D5730A|nr:DUF4238 domain-containing protein [Mucilaginibacter sp.]